MKLVIDTCGSDLRLFLFTNDRFFKSVDAELLRKSELLRSRVEGLIKNANQTIDKLTDIAVVIGPGSFIGTRSGVLFAKTIAQVLSCQLWVADALVAEPVLTALANSQTAKWSTVTAQFKLVPSQEVVTFEEKYAKDPAIGGQ